MLLVSGLALPSLLLEIEVIAARPMAAKAQSGAKRAKPARKPKRKAKARAKPRRR
jgi:hypothetical protein